MRFLKYLTMLLVGISIVCIAAISMTFLGLEFGLADGRPPAVLRNFLIVGFAADVLAAIVSVAARLGSGLRGLSVLLALGFVMVAAVPLVGLLLMWVFDAKLSMD